MKTKNRKAHCKSTQLIEIIYKFSQEKLIKSV
jgi:hypothetical protein